MKMSQKQIVFTSVACFFIATHITFISNRVDKFHFASLFLVILLTVGFSYYSESKQRLYVYNLVLWSTITSFLSVITDKRSATQRDAPNSANIAINFVLPALCFVLNSRRQTIVLETIAWSNAARIAAIRCSALTRKSATYNHGSPAADVHNESFYIIEEEISNQRQTLLAETYGHARLGNGATSVKNVKTLIASACFTVNMVSAGVFWGAPTMVLLLVSLHVGLTLTGLCLSHDVVLNEELEIGAEAGALAFARGFAGDVNTLPNACAILCAVILISPLPWTNALLICLLNCIGVFGIQTRSQPVLTHFPVVFLCASVISLFVL